MPSVATPQADTTGNAPVHTIPFTLRQSHILLRAVVDGTPATLILDTGSSVSTLSARWAEAHQVRVGTASVPAKGTGDLTVSLGTVDAMQLGGVTLHNETVA